MNKSLCFLLASASLHRGTTFVVLATLFALGIFLWRSSPLAGRALLGSSISAGLVLLCFCGDALVAAGPARTAIVIIDKTHQSDDGRLVVMPRWGLVDQSHVSTVEEHVDAARAYLASPEERTQPLVLEAHCMALRGAWLVRRQYVLRTPAQLGESDREDAARAIALQMAYDVEQEQEDAPALTGMGLTAWQFEDLPSALYATIGTREAAPVSARPLLAQKGWELVGHEARTYALPKDASPEEHDAFERARRAHALWSRPDGTLESPFAPVVARLAMAD